MISRSITRTSKILSKETMEYSEAVNGILASQYHDIKTILGNARTLATCVSLTGAALGRLSRYEAASASTIYIRVYTTPIFPTGSTVHAQIDSEMGCLRSQVATSKPVLTTRDGSLIANLSIERLSGLTTVDVMPSSISENDPAGMITGAMPYIAKFINDPVGETLAGAKLTLTLTTLSQPMTFNALKIIPMPAAGSVCIDAITVGKASSPEYLTLNGGESFGAMAPYTIGRSYPTYLHTKQVSTSMLKLKLSSNLQTSDIDGIAIGIASLIAEYNIYAPVSHVGYEITFPAGMTRLTGITFDPTKWSGSTANVQVSLFDTLDQFNSMTSPIVYRTTSGSISIDRPASGKLYMLVALQAVDNISPCLSGFTLSFA